MLYTPGARTANISDPAQITEVQSFRLLSDVSLVPLKICLQRTAITPVFLSIAEVVFSGLTLGITGLLARGF